MKDVHHDSKHTEDSKSSSEHKFPSKSEIKDKSGKLYTVVGTKSCKPCHGSGLIHDSKDSKKEYTCHECNPTVCSHCLGTHWNFDKDLSCTHCHDESSEKPKDKASSGSKVSSDSKKVEGKKTDHSSH